MMVGKEHVLNRASGKPHREFFFEPHGGRLAQRITKNDSVRGDQKYCELPTVPYAIEVSAYERDLSIVSRLWLLLKLASRSDGERDDYRDQTNQTSGAHLFNAAAGPK